MKKVRQGNTLYIINFDHEKYFHGKPLAFKFDRVTVSNELPRGEGVHIVQNGRVPRAQINDIIKHRFHIITDNRGSITAITRSRRKANALAKYLNSLNFT